MLTVTLRSMVAHRLRLVLTTLSIALGVAFLAGTFVLTDTMHKAFDDLFGKVSKGTAAVVRAEASYSGAESDDRSTVPSNLLEQIRSVDGVRAAAGDVSGYALLTDTRGKAIVTEGGAPTLGLTMSTDKALRGDIDIATGRAPSGTTEVVIDKRSATDHHIPIGAKINVLFHGPTRAFTVVGVVTFGGETNLGGATTAYFDLTTAQQVLGTSGEFDQINVAAEDGVSQSELTARVQKTLPNGVEAITGKALAQEFSDDVNDGLGFVTVMFTIFAAIALFVGSFIIWNTFTMIVAQRTREIALLRAVGASRGQVMRSLLTESLLLGVGSSALGIVLGIGVAKGLTKLMGAVGFTLPTTSSQLEPRTIWLSLIVGTLVTVVAAVVPARKATRVLPVEALRDSTPGAAAPSKRRAVIGTILTGAGVGTLLAGLFGGGIQLVGFGVLGLIFGVITLGPLAVRPMARLLGWPLTKFGASGEIAQQNAMRNTKRTASTAAALMIGLTLVVSVSVFASSLKASVGSVLGNSTNADLFVARASMGGLGFSTEVAKEVAGVPGVATVSPMGFGDARFDGASSDYSAVDPATVEKVLDLDLSAGHATDLGTDGVVVSKSVAQAKDWHVGSTVPVEFVTTGKQTMHVVGIYDRTGGFIDSDYLLSTTAQAKQDGTRLDTAALVLLAAGADKSSVQKLIATELSDHPDAKVMTKSQYEKDTNGFIDNLLIFVTVMLLLAVLIALLGIVNTLALSVFERTRELGLLRAVGMTRTQVRTMVRWESVIISVIGAVAGAVLGIVIGVALARALHDEGIDSIVVPVPQLLLYVGLAGVAGVLAAIAPGRSASKVDVLKAVVAD